MASKTDLEVALRLWLTFLALVGGAMLIGSVFGARTGWGVFLLAWALWSRTVE